VTSLSTPSLGITGHPMVFLPLSDANTLSTPSLGITGQGGGL